MLKKLVLPVIASIICFYIVFKAPVDIYNLAPMIFSGVIALIISVSFAYILYQLTKPSNTNEQHPLETLVIVGSMILWIALFVGFKSIFDNRVDQRLSADREMTVGTVNSCKVETTRGRRGRTNTSYISQISYQTKAGEHFTTEHYGSVCYTTGSTFQVAYSSSNPEIVKVITDSKQMDKLAGIKYKQLTPNELIRLLPMQKDELGIALNQMSYRWVYDEGRNAWVNHEKDLKVSKRDNTIVLLASGVESVQMVKKLEFMGFEVTSKEKIDESDPHSGYRTVYTSPEYKALTEITMNTADLLNAARAGQQTGIQVSVLLAISKN